MDIRPLGDNRLTLTNDGRLSVFAVGCGGAFSRSLGQNNYLIIKGDDHVLVDCGTKTPARLRAVGLDVTDIRNFLITHSHADHIGGLEEVMLMGRYVAKRKPVAFIEKRYQKLLWNESLKGGAASNERHNGRYLSFDDFWETVRPGPVDGMPREMAAFDIGSLNIKIFRTNHFPEQAQSWKTAAYSVGFVIDDRILFTGDTKFDASLIPDIEAHMAIEWIFQDAQFFTGGVHASLDELMQVPGETRARMLLMHYGDSYETKSDEVAERGFYDFAREGHFYDF